VSTWLPARTGTSVSVPAAGAATVCSIFIASSTISGWPAATSVPGSASTRSTEPGIGASSDPGATESAGSVNRGTSRSALAPSGPSTYTSTPRPAPAPSPAPRSTRCTAYARRTPSISSVTSSGPAASSRTDSPSCSPSTLTRSPSLVNRYATSIVAAPSA
jgi:hypothetical protein